MLRQCANTLAAKKARQPDSGEALGEYNLGSEGFFIHLRNLIALRQSIL